jgi:RimJ/RimL family protein N-acetyltransferase
MTSLSAALPTHDLRIGNGLVLRPFTPDLTEPWFALVERSRPNWSQTSSYHRQCTSIDSTRNNLTRTYQSVLNGRSYTRSIWQAGRLVGRLMVNFDLRNHSAELGWAVDVDYQGRGIARAAASNITQLLLAKGFTRVWISCIVDNIASVRIALAVGMEREGILRKSKWLNDEPHDTYIFAAIA